VRYAGLIELNCAEHVAVVCYCAGRHFHPPGQVCKMGYQAGAVKKAVLRVDVKMNEI